MNKFAVSDADGRFDLGLCVSSGQVFRWQRQPDEKWLGVDGDHAYLVSEVDDGYEVESNATQKDFESLFRLDWDAAAIEAKVLQLGPELEPYVGNLRGLRLMRPSSAVEAFFSFLCTPNNNIARITQMVRKLACYGPVITELNGQTIHRFPDVETLASISEEELRAAAFGYRGRTIPNIARQVYEKGKSWLESLKTAPYEEVHQELVALDGVGPKLADCIALFAFHHTTAVPVDTHLWQAITRLYLPEMKDKAITPQRYEMASKVLRDRFGELTGWAHQYLFYDNVLNWRERRKAESQ